VTRSHEYNAWNGMIRRCKGVRSYHAKHRYSERGITVCERWKKSANFLADMGPCPFGMTLDRIDNDKGYEPGNCRWATRSQQTRNRNDHYGGRPVIRSDGKIYETLTDAANDVKGGIGHIWQVCQGQRKTHAGFGWQYGG